MSKFVKEELNLVQIIKIGIFLAMAIWGYIKINEITELLRSCSRAIC